MKSSFIFLTMFSMLILGFAAPAFAVVAPCGTTTGGCTAPLVCRPDPGASTDPNFQFSCGSPGSNVGITLRNPLTGIDSFPSLLNRVKDFILGVIATLSVIMFVWAGILFVTSAGNEGRLGKAKQALLWAIIGLAIVVAASGLIMVITAVVGTGST